MFTLRKKYSVTLQLLLSSYIVFVTGEPIGSLTNKTHTRSSQDLPTEWPCPDANDIVPCHCYYDSDSVIDIDCSRVINEDELKAVFSKTFPFTHFRSLNMNHNSNVKTIRAGDLGAYTFESVSIHYGTLTEIEDGALASSADTLERLDLWGNDLKIMPDLSAFTKLTYVDLRSNEIANFPIMSSNSLQILELSHNDITELPEKAVQGLAALEVLYLNVNNIGAILPGTFTKNEKLQKLLMNSNGFSTIPVDAIKLYGPDTHVSLSSNRLSQISYAAVSSVTGTISLKQNQFTQLPENDFRPLLESKVLVDLSYNPFGCGCDMKWLVLNRTLVEHLHSWGHPTCSNGQAFQDLDPTFYENNC